MFEFFEIVFIPLDRHDNHVFIAAAYLSAAAMLIFLRMLSHFHISGALVAFHRDTRNEIKNRSEISKLKSGLLRRITAEYIRVAERAVTSIPTRQIVERHLDYMGLMGWRYTGLVPFLESLETGILWIGLILAFIFDGYAHTYGLMAICAYLIVRLFSAFFNVREKKAQLADEIVIFMEREIGRFFASDSGGAVLRLKNDLTEAIDKQSALYKTTMENIAATMSGTMKEISGNMIAAANAIGPIVAKAMDEKLADMNRDLGETLGEWEKAMEKASSVQSNMNETAERILHAGDRLRSAAELLATHMQGHSNALSGQLVSLVSSIEAVKDMGERLATGQEILVKQADYIEKNQTTLETAITSYEASLQNLARSLGDGLGAYVGIHAHASAEAINAALKQNVDKILNLSERGMN